MNSSPYQHFILLLHPTLLQSCNLQMQDLRLILIGKIRFFLKKYIEIKIKTSIIYIYKKIEIEIINYIYLQ